ncbi:MAG: TusE/DsrC/DsvC family sulfur relay protein [Sulfuricellaceae bacterium]|nr:TusE/DsrC/DsvC family sulfur relay protein [Sulfuricellaceae bacterium]
MGSYELTSDGRLKNLEDWSEDAARWLAQQDGLTLTDEHWEIIRLIRIHYQTYNIPPVRKLLKKEISKQLGADKAEDARLDSLFPKGLLVQGSRLAGVPIPMLDAEIEAIHSTPVKQATPQANAAPLATFKAEPIQFQGKMIAVHEKGNLVDLSEWSEDLARAMAQKEGVTLTPEHWEVINYMRKFYFKYGITPMVRLLMKNMCDDLSETKASSEYLYKLFPGGPSRQGSRIAGLPAPQGCIDE